MWTYVLKYVSYFWFDLWFSMHLFDLFQISRDKKICLFSLYEYCNKIYKASWHDIIFYQAVEKKSLFSSVQIVSEALQ